MNAPFDFGQARQAARAASLGQMAAERAVDDAHTALAEAERVYRRALARRITELRAEGVAATTCGDLARGDDAVSELRYRRDVAEGVVKSLEVAMWRHQADRRDLHAFIRHSFAVAPDGQHDAPPGHDWRS